MGYRSDVRIMTSKKGYDELRKFTDKYLSDRNYEYGNLLDNLDLDEETKYAKYIGWNSIKWYDNCGEEYADVDSIMEGLEHLASKDFSYRYARIGENYDDYEEYSNESELEEEQDLEYPSMTRYFDDDYVIENMKAWDIQEEVDLHMNNIYVNCGGSLDLFKSKKEVMDFFEDCILMSEGSERERYTNIYFSVKKHLNDDKRCFTDGSSHIFTSTIEPEEINLSEENLLKKEFGIDLNEIIKFKARNVLSEYEYIYPSTLERYEDINDLYNNYLVDKDEHSYFYFNKDSIICIDTSAGDNDKFWQEEFPIKDYEYAKKWLKGEIEYNDYLEEIKGKDIVSSNDDMEL